MNVVPFCKAAHKNGADIGVSAVRLCGKPTPTAVHASALDFCRRVITSVNAQPGR